MLSLADEISGTINNAGYSGEWDGTLSNSMSSGGDVLSRFNSAVDSGISLLGSLGRLQSAAQNAQTAQYVARANADATKAAANAQVLNAQKPFQSNTNTLMIWLAVAGLVFAAMQVIGKK